MIRHKKHNRHKSIFVFCAVCSLIGTKIQMPRGMYFLCLSTVGFHEVSTTGKRRNVMSGA